MDSGQVLSLDRSDMNGRAWAAPTVPPTPGHAAQVGGFHARAQHIKVRLAQAVGTSTCLCKPPPATCPGTAHTCFQMNHTMVC